MTRLHERAYPVCPCVLLLKCSAKNLVAGETNVAYICSRYYRAPELIFGATQYTCIIGMSGVMLPPSPSCFHLF